MIIIRNIEEIKKKIDFKEEIQSRKNLLKNIQEKCRPEKMLEVHKMEVIIIINNKSKKIIYLLKSNKNKIYSIKSITFLKKTN